VIGAGFFLPAGEAAAEAAAAFLPAAVLPAAHADVLTRLAAGRCHVQGVYARPWGHPHGRGAHSPARLSQNRIDC